MQLKHIILGAIIGTSLSACGATSKKMPEEAPKNKLTMNIPSWVLNPVVEDGIAATDCVKFSGNMSIDQKMASANARLALAQQIEIKVEGLDKTYASRVDSNDEMTTGTNFSSVSKQLTQQRLNGSRVIKSDIVDIGGQNHFCAMMTLSPTATKELFDAIMEQSKRNINPQDERFLYQEFKAAKAQEELDVTIKKLTN
ncbi:hypothetical protein [Paraglaciecola hydrolytica]|uniref:LPP20 lipoprotein n=1 Tax=Paraglaciecola hydrolytica TaxID=1799789 RepID=A0A136A1X8_9ALTE|nr:hypothetical protein [Paraglaciecola hydrolytica]KXI29242.1 hypothetical protein AX660_13935 [Paraglaciecola hydrolytica]